MLVGPVNRQPPLPLAVSALIAELLGGMARLGRYRGSPGFANTGVLLLHDVFVRYLGVEPRFHAVDVLPLNLGWPHTRKESLVCNGPLTVSAVMKLMSVHPLPRGVVA